MQNKFINYFVSKNSKLKEQKFLLAVSGGVDSMVLLHLFKLNQMYFEVAHCNFQLRGEDSNFDQKLVEGYCRENLIKCHIKKFVLQALPQQSIQMQARNLRYNWFNELMGHQTIDYLVTAHHADDNIETFFINFIRGSGLAGLSGISEEIVLRPLLPFSKQDIISFAYENQIAFREDKSNEEAKYLRNKIRHEILPVFKELNPNFITIANQNIDWLRKHQAFFKHQSKNILEKCIRLDDGIWHISLKKLFKNEGYELLLFDWLLPFGFKSWHDIYQLPQAQSGKKVLSETHQLLKNRNELILSKKAAKGNSEYVFDHLQELVFENKIISIEKINLEDYERTHNPKFKTHIFIDKNSLKFPLKIRKYQKGDYFYPFGMIGKKKLSKFFKDEKFSQLDKESLWLLCANDQILWVINHRMDDRFKIKSTTAHILKLTYYVQ